MLFLLILVKTLFETFLTNLKDQNSEVKGQNLNQKSVASTLQAQTDHYFYKVLEMFVNARSLSETIG